MCVTRFDQSECVICRVIFALGNGAVFRVVSDEIFTSFQAWVGNFGTVPPWEVVGTLYFDISYVTLNILLSWELETSLNCSVMCKPPRWFRRSSWIHCWLLLAVLSDYFGHLVTSTFLLCKFRGLPGSTPVSFPVMGRWKCLGIKRSSQPSSTTPWKRAGRKHAEAEAHVKRVAPNPDRVCSILNQNR